MATKRTKSQREATEKAALRQRLADIALGAYGGFEKPEFQGDEFFGMAGALGLDAFARWIGGIENAFLKDRDGARDLTAARYLEHYDDLDKATALLWEHGVRA